MSVRAYLRQVVLATFGHGEGHRDVLPVYVDLVLHAQDVSQFGEVPFCCRRERQNKAKQIIHVTCGRIPQRAGKYGGAERGCVFHSTRPSVILASIILGGETT